jgi:hypothetical protein
MAVHSANWKDKEESSFSEEKEAKRLLFLRQRKDTGHGLDRGRGGEVKVFWFFSSEKNILPYITFPRNVSKCLVYSAACAPPATSRHAASAYSSAAAARPCRSRKTLR